MALKSQLAKLKENWLIALLVVVLIVLLNSPLSMIFSGGVARFAENSIAYKTAGQQMRSMEYMDSGFAPSETERKLTKTASITTEVDYGSFDYSAKKLKDTVTAYSVYLLNENVNELKAGSSSYKLGSYKIKVKSQDYASFIAEIKKIGKVEYFSESSQDVTESYITIEDKLNAEKSRLERFKKMLSDAKETEDKITLTDRIFDLEKTISYLEKRLEAMDNRVDYSTVYVTIREKEPVFSSKIVSLRELWGSLMASVNALLKLLLMALPWAFLAAIVYLLFRLIKKH